MTDKTVQSVDSAKREMLKRIGVGVGAAFVVPLLASFSKDGLIISAAKANPVDADGNHNHSHKKGGGKK